MEDSKQMVYDYLDKNKISYKVIDHEPVYTMEEMDAYGITSQGNVCKNLFLRDAKGKRHFLVVLQKDKTADLKEFRTLLGTTALSFASEERLSKYLGLTKGAVSPFGILNDKDAEVEVVVDQDFANEKNFGCHPNDNTATVILDFRDIKKMIKNNGNSLTFIKIKK